MVVLEMNTVEIDRCAFCSGTWLDTGELEAMMEVSGGNPEMMARFLDAPKASRNGERRCPICNRALDVVRFEQCPDIEMDRCGKGHGIWFDHGELRDFVRSCPGPDAQLMADFFNQLYAAEFSDQTKGE